MKMRVTLTLDPAVVRNAKTVARSRRTNLSALVEDLLRQTSERGTRQPHKRFSQRWAGKLQMRESNDQDALLDALKQRHGLAER